MYNELVDRFWSKVNKKLPNECWEWTAGLFSSGYGQFSISHDKPVLAHRYSFALANKIVVGDRIVRHSCDNKKCVNPNHLLLGSHQDNMNDRSNRGRTAHNRGEAAGGVKLTTIQVKTIRALYAGGKYTMQKLASKFNVSLTLTYNIIRKKRWSHV